MHVIAEVLLWWLLLTTGTPSSFGVSARYSRGVSAPVGLPASRVQQGKPSAAGCTGAGKTGKAPCVNTPALKRQAAALSSILQELNIPSTASPWSRLEGDTAGYTSLCHPSQSGHALPTPLAMSCDESTGLVRSLELNVRSAAGQLPGSLIGLRDSLTRLTVSCSCSQQGRCPALQVNSEWPATLVNLAQLDFLGLRECPEWAGPLPAALPQQLSELQINNFGFTGPLPSSWGQATGLTRLSFITVSMIEPVPASWSTMQQLESITVLSSQLSQLFLNSLTQLKQLHYIQLIDCWGIDLTLPEPWAEVASLEWVQAVNSTFTGRLPASWWARLHMLAHVSLERNRLTGPLPSSLMNWQPDWSSIWKGSHYQRPGHAHVLLNIGDNQLTGGVADTLEAWDPLALAGQAGLGGAPGGVVKLDVSFAAAHNRLTGALPAKMASRVQKVDLGYNQLTRSLEDITGLDVGAFIVPGNNLQGPFPTDWTTNRFTQLDLSGNNLGVALPAAGFPPNLADLRLQGCNLTGQLPPSGLSMGHPNCSEDRSVCLRIWLSDNPLLTGCVPRDWVSESAPHPIQLCTSPTSSPAVCLLPIELQTEPVSSFQPLSNTGVTGLCPS